MSLPITVFDLDVGLALGAGAMAPVVKRFGLSLGDRICLALAAREKLPAITAEKVWEQAGREIGVAVGPIRWRAQPCRYSFIALLKKKSRRCCSGSGIGSTWVGSS